jgi:hypothetical protein
MKRIFLSIALSAVLMFSFVFLACNRSTKEITPTTTEQSVRKEKSTPTDPYAVYGEMHNAGLTHFKQNFRIPNGTHLKKWILGFFGM